MALLLFSDTYSKMAPLADHLVGYLSMFLQLGVLALLTLLAMLVRTSLGRRPFDGWTIGLGTNALALLVLGVAAVGRDAAGGGFRVRARRAAQVKEFGHGRALFTPIP